MEDAETYGMGIEYAKAMLGENYTETAIAAEEKQFNSIYSKIKQAKIQSEHVVFTIHNTN